MVIGCRRRLPFAAEMRQIVDCHRSTQCVRFGDDSPGDLSFVEAVAALLLQNAESLREFGASINLSGYWPFSVDVPGGNGIGVRLCTAVAGIGRNGRQRVGQAPIVSDP